VLPWPAVDAAEPRAGTAAYYFAGAGSWFLAWGMQQVLFTWLVVGELEAPAALVGPVQMSRDAPVLLLLLLGGAAADRFDRRRTLVALHALAGTGMALLALATARGAISLPLLVGYAVSMGVLASFALPARDALLSDVSRGALLRAVTLLTVVQFGGQAVGALAGGTADWVGVAPALGLQAALMGAGALACLGLPRPEDRPAGGREAPGPGAIVAGLREVLASRTLRPPVVLASAVGLFLAGPWAVLVPLLIRDHYHRGVGALSLFMAVLLTGTVVGAAALLRMGPRIHRGRLLVTAQALAGATLGVLALGLPFAGALAAAFVWGLCVASFHSAGRAIVQEAASEANRARVLSVYTLALVGSAVLGSPLSGLLASLLGTLAALALGGAGLVAFVVVVSWRTPVLQRR